MRYPAPRPAEPAVWHAADCQCADCNPPVPSIPTQSWSALEVIGGFALGLLNAWILDRVLDGPGIQIMFGF